MPHTVKITTALKVVLFALLTSNFAFADNSALVSQQQIQKQLSSDTYRARATKIAQFEQAKNPAALLEFMKTLQKDKALPPFSKESLLEESISALSQLPRTDASQNILKQLSNYQTQSKIELSDGPHTMQVNATSVPSLAKLALDKWETADLSTLFQKSIRNGRSQELLRSSATDKTWLKAVRQAINNSERFSLQAFATELKQIPSESKTLMLSYLCAKKLDEQTSMQAGLLQLSKNRPTQAFALNELRELTVDKHFDIFKASLNSDYLSSFALSQIGHSTDSNATDLIFDKLADQKLGGQAAFALRVMNIEQLTERVNTRLNSSNDELLQKRLLLSLKLHPDGNQALQEILSSERLSLVMKQELSAWSN